MVTVVTVTHRVHPMFTIVKRSNRQLANSVLATKESPDVDTEEQSPLELERIAHEQKEDKELRKLKEKDEKPAASNAKRIPMINTKVINNVEVVTYNDQIYIPSSLWKNTTNWYHHYLQHPGASRMEKTLGSVVYWPNMSKDIRRLCTTCKLCQLVKRTKGKYGKLPPKDVKLRPWHTVCVDYIGPFTIKTKNPKTKKIRKNKIRALTIIDPATGWFEMGHIPEDDMNSQRVSQLMNQLWLSRYPRPICCICDNDSEFKK